MKLNRIILNTLRESEARPQYLSDLEYRTICEEFVETLTKKEYEFLEGYTTHSGFSDRANGSLKDFMGNEYKMSYRVKNDKNKRGYSIKKATYADVVKDDSIELDKDLNYMKTKDESEDETVSFNYDMFTDARKYMKNMDAIFAKKGIRLDKDILVHRKGHETLEQLMNGHVRRGYTSTSAKSRINKKTAGDLILGSREFDIVVLAGTPILPLELIAGPELSKQHEILLPRNIRLELVEDKTDYSKSKVKEHYYVIARID